MEQPIEMTEDNRAIAEEYFRAVNAGDITRLDTLFSDDIIWHQPGAGVLSGTYEGKDDVFGLFRMFGEISNGTFEIDDVESIMGNGDLVSAIVHFRAEKGSENMSMRGVDVMRIEDGKIKEMWLFSESQEDEDEFWSA